MKLRISINDRFPFEAAYRDEFYNRRRKSIRRYDFKHANELAEKSLEETFENDYAKKLRFFHRQMCEQNRIYASETDPMKQPQRLNTEDVERYFDVLRETLPKNSYNKIRSVIDGYFQFLYKHRVAGWLTVTVSRQAVGDLDTSRKKLDIKRLLEKIQTIDSIETVRNREANKGRSKHVVTEMDRLFTTLVFLGFKTSRLVTEQGIRDVKLFLQHIPKEEDSSSLQLVRERFENLEEDATHLFVTERRDGTIAPLGLRRLGDILFGMKVALDIHDVTNASIGENGKLSSIIFGNLSYMDVMEIFHLNSQVAHRLVNLAEERKENSEKENDALLF